MHIGELAAKSGVAPSRIRFYEKYKLLPAASRLGNGYRDYTTSMIATLRFVEDAQSLGFSLREIREVLPVMNSSAAIDTVVPALERKLSDVEVHVRASQALRR